MKKETDYIAEYQEEMQKMQQMKVIPPTKQGWERFDLTIALVSARQSQFVRKKNEEEWHRLEADFYPNLCRIAKVQGGRVEMDMNEDTFSVKLTYMGNALSLDKGACMGLSEFSTIVSAAEDVSISVSDGFFKIEFLFEPFNLIQVSDHSEEIAKIKRKIWHHKLEHINTKN